MVSPSSVQWEIVEKSSEKRECPPELLEAGRMVGPRVCEDGEICGVFLKSSNVLACLVFTFKPPTSTSSSHTAANSSVGIYVYFV